MELDNILTIKFDKDSLDALNKVAENIKDENELDSFIRKIVNEELEKVKPNCTEIAQFVKDALAEEINLNRGLNE